MRIYVDMDDVLCETAAYLCDLAARAFARHVAYEDVFQFDLQQVFGFSNDEMKRFMALAHTNEELLAHPITPNAPETLRAFRAAGHDVHIVTGRPASAHAPTEEWLRRAGLDGFSVTYVDKYGRDACYAHRPDDPPTVPLAALLARTYDIAIDDSPNVLRHLAAWPDTRILVFNRPWNKTFPLAPNMTRVENWQEIGNLVTT